jgi:Zn-dependent peptidase ImmA (M78 family)
MPNNVNLADYFNSAELLAEKFLEIYFREQPTVYPIDPFRMLADLDIPFTFRDFKNYEGVYIAADAADERPAVGINKNRSITRQRFTAAHEICHHLKDSDKETFCPIFAKNAIEKFADRFAAALLMPPPQLRQQVALYECNGYIQFDDVLKVADYFAVSFEACLFRIAYMLHKIDGLTDSKSLKKRIGKYKPNQRRSLLNLPNYDIEQFKAVLDNTIAFFIYNSNRAVWYRFKNNFIYNENRLEGLEIDLPTVSEIITDLRLNKQIMEILV